MSKSRINKTGRSENTPGGWVRLEGRMLDCAAWKALTPYAHDLYIALKRRHRRYQGGKNNNGRIPMSRREAAAATGRSEGAMGRAFHDLIAKGFIKITRESVFTIKDTRAREYALTEFPVGDKLPTKEFQHWTTQIQNTGTPEIPDGYTGDTRKPDLRVSERAKTPLTGTPEIPVSDGHGYTGDTTYTSHRGASSGRGSRETDRTDKSGKGNFGLSEIPSFLTGIKSGIQPRAL